MGRRCLAYVSGPIDAAKVYREWRSNEASDYFGTIYLAHLYALLDEFDAAGLIITSLRGVRHKQVLDHLTIINLPMPRGKSGVAYHLAMAGWTFRCMREILRYRPATALLTAGQDYFWLFRVLRLFRIRLLASLHCTLWPKFARARLHQRIFTFLNGKLFYPACDHIQAVSDEIVLQISTASPRAPAGKKFLPTYEKSRFSQIEPPQWPAGDHQFRLLYIGRMEANKGILDLVEIVHRLEKQRPGRFLLDMCGEGTAAGQLEQKIKCAQLEHAIRMNGQCSTTVLTQLFSACHAVVVPTRSDFEEGYAKVAAEAVLNLRPVILSAACPALADVAPAAVEARVDDVDDYVRAILSLSDDPDLYACKVEAAGECRNIYFDEANSYGAVLRTGLEPLISRSSAAAVVNEQSQSTNVTLGNLGAREKS